MQLSAIDLNLLVVLDALLATASVKQASARLSLSSSATSHALARLRELLADPLLVRSGQRLVRTPRADALAPRVRAAVAAAAAVLVPEVEPDPGSLARRFTIAATDHMAFLMLRPLSAELSRLAPGVALYVESVHEHVFDKLREGTVDLAMGAFPQRPAAIEADELFRDRYVCLLRRGHPALARRLTLRRYAALDHVLIAPRGVPVGRIDNELAERGYSRRIARTVASFHIAPHLVAESDLVVTMSARIAGSYTERLALQAVRPPVDMAPYPLRQLWHRRVTGDRELGWLRQVARALARGLPAV